LKKKLEGGHTDFVTCVAFSKHDPNVLASGSTDKSVVVWSLKAGQPIYTLGGDYHGDEVGRRRRTRRGGPP
jgi:WD40 repeat protein